MNEGVFGMKLDCLAKSWGTWDKLGWKREMVNWVIDNWGWTVHVSTS